MREPRARGADVVGLDLDADDGAARALTRAALGRPLRDLATSRSGTVQYFLARRSPRRLLDRITTMRMRRLVRVGQFPETGLAGGLAARLSAR